MGAALAAQTSPRAMVVSVAMSERMMMLVVVLDNAEQVGGGGGGGGVCTRLGLKYGYAARWGGGCMVAVVSP